MAEAPIKTLIESVLTSLLLTSEQFRKEADEVLKSDGTLNEKAYVRLEQIQNVLTDAAKIVNSLRGVENNYRRLTEAVRTELKTLQDKSKLDDEVRKEIKDIKDTITKLPTSVETTLTGGGASGTSKLRELLKQDMETVIKAQLLDEENINSIIASFLQNSYISNLIKSIQNGIVDLPTTFASIVESSPIFTELHAKVDDGFDDLHQIVTGIADELPGEFAADFDLLMDYVGKIHSRVMNLASTSRVTDYYKETTDLQNKIGKAVLKPFQADGHVSKMLLRIFNDSRDAKDALTAKNLQTLLDQIDVVKSFKLVLNDLPDGTAVKEVFSALSELQKDKSSEKIKAVFSQLQSGGEIYTAIANAARDSGKATDQLSKLQDIPNTIGKLSEKETTNKDMRELNANIQKIFNEFRSIQGKLDDVPPSGEDDVQMLDNLGATVNRKLALVPLVNKLNQKFEEFLGKDSKFTFRLKEDPDADERRRFDQSGLLRPPPDPHSFLNVASFWHMTSSTPTAVWGLNSKVLHEFRTRVETGAVAQLFHPDNAFANAFTAIMVGLVAPFQEYKVSLSLVDLPKILASDSYQNRVEQGADWIRMRAMTNEANTMETANAAVEEYLHVAKHKEYVTRQMLNYILEEVSDILKFNATDLPNDVKPHIAAAVIMRSSQFGGHRIVVDELEDPNPNRPWTTHIMFIANIGGHANQETSTEWAYGPQWAAFGLPGVMKAQSESLNSTPLASTDSHIQRKRRLDDLFGQIRRSDAYSPTQREELREQLYRALTPSESRVHSPAVGSDNGNEQTTIAQRLAQPGQATGEPLPPQPGVLRSAWSMSNLADRGKEVGRAILRPMRQPVAEEPEAEAEAEQAQQQVPRPQPKQPGTMFTVPESDEEVYGPNIMGFHVGPNNAELPFGLFTDEVMDYLSNDKVRDLSEKYTIEEGRPCCLATTNAIMKNETPDMFDIEGHHCFHCDDPAEPHLCVFYIGNNMVLVRPIKLEDDVAMPSELTLWTDNRTVNETELTRLLDDARQSASQMKVNNNYIFPLVPSHFGRNGLRVYVGPAPFVFNEVFFSPSSLTALKTSRKVKKRGLTSKEKYDHEQVRRQCKEGNEGYLYRCMATYSTNQPPKKDGWDNPRGPCNECEWLKRQCVLMIDTQCAYIMGTGTAGPT